MTPEDEVMSALGLVEYGGRIYRRVRRVVSAGGVCSGCVFQDPQISDPCINRVCFDPRRPEDGAFVLVDAGDGHN